MMDGIDGCIMSVCDLCFRRSTDFLEQPCNKLDNMNKVQNDRSLNIIVQILPNSTYLT
jgi:hypothetical protein